MTQVTSASVPTSQMPGTAVGIADGRAAYPVQAGSNCALSVEPAMAVVVEAPPDTAIVTASK